MVPLHEIIPAVGHSAGRASRTFTLAQLAGFASDQNNSDSRLRWRKRCLKVLGWLHAAGGFRGP